jgi:hypothetical protein
VLSGTKYFNRDVVDVDQKQLESFEMWCWRRMEKISWIDHVRNEEVMLGVNSVPMVRQMILILGVFNGIFYAFEFTLEEDINDTNFI